MNIFSCIYMTCKVHSKIVVRAIMVPISRIFLKPIVCVVQIILTYLSEHSL